MAYERLLFEKKDNIATVTMNNPARMNALDMIMRAELRSLLADVAADREIKVLVLTGAGKAFCAGGDITSMEGETAPSGRDRMKAGAQHIIRLMMELEKPIIAAVNGVAVGAGMNIALAADMIIAADNARFQQSFVKIGLIPDLGGFYSLSLRIGVPRAKEVMMTARFIDAKEADSLGLVNRVVPPEQLMQEAQSLAATLAAGPGRAYAMIKAALNLWPMNLQSYLEIEANMQAIAFVTKDFDEGRRAFLEKRKPEFTGE